MVCLSKKITKSTLALALCLTHSAANSTNGLWLPGFGAKSVGMGGTTIALQLDGLAQAVNPAGISGMEHRFDVGFGIFNPPRRAYVDAEDDPTFGSNVAESRSSRDWFLIPNMAYVSPINDKWTWGIAAIGAGLGVWYDGIYDFKNTGEMLSINLIQMQMPLSLSYKINDNFSVGASAVFAAQMFEAKGFGSFEPVTSDVDHLTDNGKDFSFGGGLRVGILGSTDSGNFTYGAYYHSRVYMSEFDEYAGLLAEQGDLDIPANYGAGISFKVVPKLTTAFDIMMIEWSSIRSMGNKGPALYTGEPIGTAVGAVGVGALGRDDGMGFGWEDQTVYKLGFAWQYSDKTVFTTGFNYGKSPIPDTEYAFGVVGPAVTEKHWAIGWQQILNGYTIFGAKEAEFSMSFIHGFKNKMAGTAGIGTDENGQPFAGYAEFEMVQNQLELSYGLKF